MASNRHENIDCKLYIGDLPRDVQEKDIDRAFSYYGSLRNIWLARNPPGFAFVEFEDSRDAEDAVKGVDGTKICGARVRVEHANGRRSRSRREDLERGRYQSPARFGRGVQSGRRAFDPNDRCFVCEERGHYSYDCPRSSRGGRGRGGARHGGGVSRRGRSSSHSRSRSCGASRRRSRSRSPLRSTRDSSLRSNGHHSPRRGGDRSLRRVEEHSPSRRGDHSPYRRNGAHSPRRGGDHSPNHRGDHSP